MLQRRKEEQQAKIEKISLVALLSKMQKMLSTLCRPLKRNGVDFYQNRNISTG
jgi:hypothetical protein